MTKPVIEESEKLEYIVFFYLLNTTTIGYEKTNGRQVVS
jgi:hypothetical protein